MVTTQREDGFTQPALLAKTLATSPVNAELSVGPSREAPAAASAGYER